MEYFEFEKKFLSELNNKDTECLTTIENNEELVKLYLQDTENPVHINTIVDHINNLILKEVKSFKFYKTVLYHPHMTEVLEKFRESDVLIKACKQENEVAQDWLFEMKVRNLMDKNGKTVPMYLLEQENYEQFCDLIQELSENVDDDIDFDINHRSKITHESILSILIMKYKEIYTHESYVSGLSSASRYDIGNIARAFISVVNYPGCDMNVAIDDEGNTPLMFFIMMEDYTTINYLVSQCPEIDFSKKNIHGISASFLAIFMKNENYLSDIILKHKTFNYDILDKHHNNLLIYSVLGDNPVAFCRLLTRNEKAINQINDNKENALIIATKLGFLEKINSYILHRANVNQQDYLGNTALYYAVKLKDEYAVNLLAFYGANANIKNNQGVSPLIQAKEMGEKSIIRILKKPVPPHIMKNKVEEKSSGFMSSGFMSSGFFFFNRGKKTDEKTEKYTKTYQIKNYKKDYQNLIDNVNSTYKNINRFMGIEKELEFAYYHSIKNHDNYIPSNYFDSGTMSRNFVFSDVFS